MKDLVLVTGGAGFIGSNLVDKLIKDNYKVVMVDDLSTGKSENINKDVIFHKVDISDYETLLNKLSGYSFKYIFHVAAKARIQPSFEHPQKYFQTNVVGTFNLLEFARKVNPDKFVFVSSSSIYGDTGLEFDAPMAETLGYNPSSHYAYQKMYGELMVKQYHKMYGLKCIAVRPFNVYGERQLLDGAYAAVVGIFLCQAEKGTALTIVGDGKQKRDFTYVQDIVEGLIKGAQSVIIDGKAYNLGTGNNYSVQELADWISDYQEYVPVRKGEYDYTLANNLNARTDLGWNPSDDLKEWVERCLKAKI